MALVGSMLFGLDYAKTKISIMGSKPTAGTDLGFNIQANYILNVSEFVKADGTIIWQVGFTLQILL